VHFINGLYDSINHDLGSCIDFKWIITVFSIGRELVRGLVPSYRAEVTEMLNYFLHRAEVDLAKVGGWDTFIDKNTIEFPVYSTL
jgi:hypothetical protein